MTAPLLLRQRVVNVAHAVRDLLGGVGFRIDGLEDDGRGALVLLVQFTDEDPVRVRIGEPQ